MKLDCDGCVSCCAAVNKPAAEVKSKLIERVKTTVSEFTQRTEWRELFDDSQDPAQLRGEVTGYHVMLSRLVSNVLEDQWKVLCLSDARHLCHRATRHSFHSIFVGCAGSQCVADLRRAGCDGLVGDASQHGCSDDRSGLDGIVDRQLDSLFDALSTPFAGGGSATKVVAIRSGKRRLCSGSSDCRADCGIFGARGQRVCADGRIRYTYQPNDARRSVRQSHCVAAVSSAEEVTRLVS